MDPFFLLSPTCHPLGTPPILFLPLLPFHLLSSLSNIAFICSLPLSLSLSPLLSFLWNLDFILRCNQSGKDDTTTILGSRFNLLTTEAMNCSEIRIITSSKLMSGIESWEFVRYGARGVFMAYPLTNPPPPHKCMNGHTPCWFQYPDRVDRVSVEDAVFLGSQLLLLLLES